MTLGEFRKLTQDLPDSYDLMYWAYYKGCCLSAYDARNLGISFERECVVLNPGKDFDDRGVDFPNKEK